MSQLKHVLLETDRGQAMLVSAGHVKLPMNWRDMLAAIPVNHLHVNHEVTLNEVQVRITARDEADNALVVYITAHQLRGVGVDVKTELWVGAEQEVYTIHCSTLSVCRALRLLAPGDSEAVDTLLYLLTALADGDLCTYIARQAEFEHVLGCTLVQRCAVALPTTGDVLARGWLNQLVDAPGVMVIRDDGLYVHRPTADNTSCGLTLLDYIYLTTAAQQEADMVSDVWVDELPTHTVTARGDIAVGFDSKWRLMAYQLIHGVWCLLGTPSASGLRAQAVRTCLDDLRAWMAAHALTGNETQLAQYENEVQKALNEEV